MKFLNPEKMPIIKVFVFTETIMRSGTTYSNFIFQNLYLQHYFVNIKWRSKMRLITACLVYNAEKLVSSNKVA